MIVPFFLAAATVLLPDGQPAGGARAVSLSKESFAHVVGTEFARPVETISIEATGLLEVTTETAGRWVILHPGGWADATLDPDTAEVRLEPWCEISGSVEASASVNASVSYHRSERPHLPSDRGSIFWTATAPVAADGTYCLRHVPSGPGSVGLLREEKSDRRILRWRDFPRLVNVPSPGPLHLAGGVSVSGRIVAGDLPAVITLAGKNSPLVFHGLTDASGKFTIPGVLAGTYRLSARPNLGSATQNIPHRTLEVGADPLDLGELTGTEPDVETDRRVELDEELPARLRIEAAKHSDRPIEKIWIGELGHPGGNYGARITFLPEPDAADPTKSTQKSLLIQIPGVPFRKLYTEHDSLGHGFRFSNEPFEKITSFERPLRTFPLKSSTLHLPIQDEVSYEDALALLLAVEAGEIRRPEPKCTKTGTNTWSVSTTWSGGNFSAESLPQIIGIQQGKDNEIKIQTRNRPFGGSFYHFKKLPEGGFEQTGGGGWVS